MNRGAAGCRAFPSPEDAAEFLGLVGEICRTCPVEVHAYCVMGNHYHLLIRALGLDLERVMESLEGAYAIRHARRHGASGPSLGGKGLTLPVHRSRHLLVVSRYIHRNPVEAGLVTRPEDWPHSSFRAYLNPAFAPSWLRTAAILGAFGSIGARQRYRSFVEEGTGNWAGNSRGRARIGPMHADGDLREGILRRMAISMNERGPAGPERAPTLAMLARALSREFSVPEVEVRLRPAGRTAGGVLVRGALVHAALGLGRYRLREIAVWLGYRSTGSAVRAAIRFREAAVADRRLAERLRSVVERLRAKPS